MKEERFCLWVSTIEEANEIAAQKNVRLYLIESCELLYLDSNDSIVRPFEKLIKVYEPNKKGR